MTVLCIISLLAGLHAAPDPAPPFAPGQVFFREHAQGALIIPDGAGGLTAIGPIGDILERFACRAILRPFPGIERSPESGLHGVYVAVFPEDVEVASVIDTLEQSGWVDYAEPRYIRRSTSMLRYPDDPLWPAQWFLGDITAFSGWGITPGDDSVTVAILDTGVNWQHPDLAAGIAVNHAEDVNGNGVFDDGDNDGVDADEDQFVDNVIGWDFVALPPEQLYPGEDGAPPDNDPMDFDGHGTHCAGDAAAVTDNGVGVAAIGWRAKILPVRVGYRASDGNGYMLYSIEGIYYAATHGAEVISMSYGGSFYSNTEQAAIDYAAGLGVVMVGAAGNDNSEDVSYPAHYDNVIAVAATDQFRNRADFSNYGTWVDVAAPGVEIYSTTVSGGYGNMQGTSMATPITAGLCALVKSLRPSWSSAAVEAHLMMRCDTLPTFPPELGGRHINAFRALDVVVRVDSLAVVDTLGNHDGYPDFGEDVALHVRVHNSHADVDYVHLLLSSDDSLVTVTDEMSDLGPVPYGEDRDDAADPLSFRIAEGSGSASIRLLLTIADALGDTLRVDLDFPVGHADWLIVNGDDDDAPDLTSFYADALDSLGQSYDTWRTSRDGSPAPVLPRYERVIWFTGQRAAGGIFETDGTSLAQAVDDGTRLFLTGQNLLSIWSTEIPEFVESYLHATVVEPQVPDYILQGTGEGNLSLTGPLYIFGSGGAGNQSDVDGLAVGEGATTEIVFDEADPTLAAGYSLTEPGRMVVLSFGYEAINGIPAGSVSREELMGRIVEFFSSTGVDRREDLGGTLRLEAIQPNPCFGSVRIRYWMERPGELILTAYNLLGERVVRQRAVCNAPGSQVIRWDPGPEVPGGIYVIRLRSGSDLQTARAVFIR